MKAYEKDILRTIRKEKKRLVALMAISALGVTMMCGLKAACDDLRRSADAFFDGCRLHDLTVVSTLGLTDADVEALLELDSVCRAEGSYSESVRISMGDSYTKAEIKTFDPAGIGVPYVKEGRLPVNGYEIAVSEKYLRESGKRLYDTLTVLETLEEAEEVSDEDFEGLDELNEAEKPSFPNTRFRIVGTVVDATSVVNPDGSTSYRSTGSDVHTCFVLPSAVDSDYYTAVNLLVEGAEGLDCFSDEYSQRVSHTKNEIETLIKSRRQQARYDSVRGEAEDKLNDAQEQLNEAFSDAEEELSDARTELDDGWKEYEDGVTKLNNEAAEGYRKINQAKAELQGKYQEINAGLEQLDAAEAELDRSEAEVEAAPETLAGLQAQLEALNGVLAQLEGGIAGCELALQDPELTEEMKTGLEAKLAELQAELAALEPQAAALNEGIAAAQAVVDNIESYRQQFAAARGQIAQNRAALAEGVKQLDEAFLMLMASEEEADIKVRDGRKKLEEGRAELEDGEKEYSDGVAEYHEKRAEAEEKMSDAREEIDDIRDCVWYVRDRYALDGFADISSDSDCIESIGLIFPVLFLLVAVLISLTTITRMVDENRGLIGTYQALGFRNGEIRRKFALYSSAATLSGGMIGNIFGFIVLPKILFVIFDVMYLLPYYNIGYNPLYGLGGTALFYTAIVGTTLISCNSELHQTPAALMRPKAPKSGSRILLERIRPVWSRLSFLNKVTFRNLFRYKKRFFMTVFGIAGCMGLLLCAFSIKDTVDNLLPLQYERIIAYNIMAVTAGDEDYDALEEYCASRSDDIESSMPIYISSVDVYNSAGDTIAVQLYAVEDGADMSAFFTLKDTGGNDIEIGGDGFFLTENISTILGIMPGETVRIQDMALEEAGGNVTSLLEYYLGNCIFVTRSRFEELFGECSPNARLLCLKDGADEKSFTEDLEAMDEILSVTSIQKMKVEFSAAFILMDLVVYIVLVLAGVLAFVVLFTLSTTNISERDRELATIKVLGFYDGEVHRYVNKETLILTVIGILAGIPLGYLFGDLLGSVLKLPAIVFRTTVKPVSNIYCAGITLAFALLVNNMTDRLLDGIDPIEALKSVE